MNNIMDSLFLPAFRSVYQMNHLFPDHPFPGRSDDPAGGEPMVEIRNKYKSRPQTLSIPG